MSVSSELLSLVRDVAHRIDVPVVGHIHIPKPQPQPDRNAEFGLISLTDGSSGLFYAWLDDTLERLHAQLDGTQELIGRHPLEIAAEVDSGDPVDKALGLAAICAMSQHVFRVADYTLGCASDSMGRLRFTLADHVGMVGLFPSLAQRLGKLGITLTVIERKPDLLNGDYDFEVTLDPSRLRACNKVLCTASTMLNDSMDEVLQYCKGAQHIAVIGPTASCLPDPLFDRGVDIVGGSVVTDYNGLLDRFHQDLPWGETVRKYVIEKIDYPGLTTLLPGPS